MSDSAPPPPRSFPHENPAVVRAKARLGTTLRGKYRLDRVIGMGGMAVVYAATHRNRAKFAIKVLHTELSIRDDIRNRFLREGYVANTVRHPGAVAVVDDDIAEDGAAFIVMELLEGATVESLAVQRDAPLPVPAALAIGYQVLDILAAAHANGVVHRDIKPANLFVTRDGALKVLDFGIARLRDATPGTETATGMTLGTPAFMGPEQALGDPRQVDGQSDVWAVGATLFWAISGQLVHVGNTSAQFVIQSATARARPITTLVPSLPPAIADIVDRALAFDKRDRWPSALAMQQTIRAAYLALFGECSDERVRSDLVASVKAQLVAAQARSAGAPLAGNRISGARASLDSPLHDAETGAPFAPNSPPAEGSTEASFAGASKELSRTESAAASLGHASTAVSGGAEQARIHAVSAPPRENSAPPPVRSRRKASAQTVSSAPSGRLSRMRAVGLGVGVAAALAAVRFWATHPSHEQAHGGAPAGSAATDLRPEVPSVAPALPRELTVVGAPSPPALLPAAETAPTASFAGLPRAKPSAVAPSRHPAPPAMSVAPPPSAAPDAGAREKPNCNPNYYIDPDGEKHFKKGCL